MLMKRTHHVLSTLVLFTLAVATAFAQGPNNSGTYYQNADGKKGAALKTALCDIIRPNLESNVTSYTPGLWNAYKTTDVRPNPDNDPQKPTIIWDMYSNTSRFVPGDDQDKGSDGSEGSYYNREHSFPRNWFGGAVAPMNTDLFHVYPTDKVVNGKRSNYPFGETTGNEYKSNNDYSKLGGCTTPGLRILPAAFIGNPSTKST